MKRYWIALPLIGIVALTGCTTEHPESAKPEAAQSLVLSVNMVGQKNTSRASAFTGNAFNEGARIEMILVDKDAAAQPLKYGVRAPYTCVADYTVPDAPTFGWQAADPDNELIVYEIPAMALAHYPATLPHYASLSSDMRELTIDLPNEMPFGSLNDYNGDNITRLTLKEGEQPAEIYFPDGSIDFMTGSCPDELSSLTQSVKAEITMKHAMAMVVVRLNSEPTMPNSHDKVSGISLQNITPAAGPLYSGTIALLDNTFTPDVNKPIQYDRPMSNFSQGTYLGILVFPATFDANQVQIVANVGAAKYTFKLPATLWNAGSVYVYNINLSSANGILDAPVVIKDWIEQKENVELE